MVRVGGCKVQILSLTLVSSLSFDVSISGRFVGNSQENTDSDILLHKQCVSILWFGTTLSQPLKWLPGFTIWVRSQFPPRREVHMKFVHAARFTPKSRNFRPCVQEQSLGWGPGHTWWEAPNGCKWSHARNPPKWPSTDSQMGGPFILRVCPIPRHFAPRPTTLVTLTSPRLTGPFGPPSPDLCFWSAARQI